MIDYFKVLYPQKKDLEKFLMDKTRFTNTVNNQCFFTKEVIPGFRAKFNGLRCSSAFKWASVRGSIHKMFNISNGNGEQNHNDFTYSNFIDACEILEGKIPKICLQQLNVLEIGVNIPVPCSPERIIDLNVLMHKEEPYNHDKEYNGDGKLKQYDYNEYVLKIYDKGKQYNLEKSILRFEIRFIKRRLLQKLGIDCLEDLKSKPKLERLSKLLLKRFDELVIIDNYSARKDITNKDAILLDRYANPIWWKRNSENYSYSQKYYRIKKLNVLINKYKLNSLKIVIRESLELKIGELING